MGPRKGAAIPRGGYKTKTIAENRLWITTQNAKGFATPPIKYASVSIQIHICIYNEGGSSVRF